MKQSKIKQTINHEYEELLRFYETFIYTKV
jgi:hypothetical protein